MYGDHCPHVEEEIEGNFDERTLRECHGRLKMNGSPRYSSDIGRILARVAGDYYIRDQGGAARNLESTSTVYKCKASGN